MTALTASEIKDLSERHPEVFHSSFLKRFRGWLISAGIVAYLFFAWNFFNVAHVLGNGNWGIAGSYLADWVSYEVRPDIEFEENYVVVEFPRFSPLGNNPKPDWISETSREVEIKPEIKSEDATSTQKAQAFSFMAPDAPTAEKPAQAAIGFMAPGAPTAQNSDPLVEAKQAIAKSEFREETVRAEISLDSGLITVVPGRVTLVRGEEILEIDIDLDKAVYPRGALPNWARQKYENGKVVAQFGVDGRVEVENDEVKIRRRFFGWENFIFDTNSPFWGKSFTEVAELVLSGERIKPEQSNLSLAWNNIVNNAEWQHGDVWLKLLQTIVMAFVGTLFATLLAFPLAFVAARNITPNFLFNQVTKRMFDFLRSVDMLIWALFFTRAFGPGPLAGMSAIFFTDTGTLGKLYSEALENIDDKQREGVKSLGASPVLVQRFGVVPQILPVFLSQSLYFWESNTRSATIIGAVGAGGIGLKLWEAMRTNQDWENVFYMVLLILMVVYIFDTISGKLRAKLTK